MLQIPLQAVTWILRTAYINGEAFTMNGKRMRLELVVCPEDADLESPREDSGEKPENSGEKNKKVISFNDLKKR